MAFKIPFSELLCCTKFLQTVKLFNLDLMKNNFNKLKCIISICLMIASIIVHAQNKLNFGLTQKQPDNTLPVGVAKTEKAIRKQSIIQLPYYIRISRTIIF